MPMVKRSTTSVGLSIVRGKEKEVSFKVKSHGNTKDKRKPFLPTRKTILKEMKSQESRKETPKVTLQHITRNAGGVMSAESSGSVPRGRQQIYDSRRLPRPASTSTCVTQDSFTDCLRASKNQEKDFIRLCMAHPEELYVVYEDRQINNLVRLCTSSVQNTLLSVDPTFDCGKFAVTPITIHHLMLNSRKTGKHPIILGPVMIHHRKTYQTYHILASRILAANPKLKDIRAIITDGEEPLQNSFNDVFSRAQPLRVFRHFQQNMDSALKDMGISAKKERDPFLNDVFGHTEDDVYVKGLCDAEDEREFRVLLDSYRDVWKERVALILSNANERVSAWITNRAELLCKTMIREARKKAGLGSPHKKAYTNMSEAMNHVLSVRCPEPQPSISFK